MAAPKWSSDVSIQADAGIVMDFNTGTVLHEENMDRPCYPVSITKILAVLIALEQYDLNEMIIFSRDDVYNVEARSSSAGVDEGDVPIVRDCLYALMLASANENANALACHVSGSREALAQLMNEKTQNLGCTRSHFSNPSGLNDENHYITAHDMALIARAVIQNPEFLTINDTRGYQLTPTKWIPEGGYVANHREMLNRNEVVYCPSASADKVGYIPSMGDTLVTCARKNDVTLITVVLNGCQPHYSDTKVLFDLGFRNFQSPRTVDYETGYKSLGSDMTIIGMTSGDSISLELDRSGRVVTPRDANFTDTQSVLTYDLDSSHLQTAIACVSYTYNDRPVGSIYLCSSGLKRSAASLTSQDASGAPAVSAGQDGETGNPVPSDSSGCPDAPGLQDTPEIPSSAETPHGQTPAPTPAPYQDIISKEETAASIRIPANILAVLGVALSLTVITAIVATVKIHMRRKEEEDLYLKCQRGLERLEDIGFSSLDFERLVAQRHVSSSPLGKKGKRGRGRGRKKSFFR